MVSKNTHITDDEAKRLVTEGHSIEQLIDLFDDRHEQQELYINTALAWNDFAKIVDALKFYKENHHS